MEEVTKKGDKTKLINAITKDLQDSHISGRIINEWYVKNFVIMTIEYLDRNGYAICKK